MCGFWNGGPAVFSVNLVVGLIGGLAKFSFRALRLPEKRMVMWSHVTVKRQPWSKWRWVKMREAMKRQKEGETVKLAKETVAVMQLQRRYRPKYKNTFTCGPRERTRAKVWPTTDPPANESSPRWMEHVGLKGHFNTWQEKSAVRRQVWLLATREPGVCWYQDHSDFNQGKTEVSFGS